MNKKELIEKVEILETENHDLRGQLEKMVNEAYKDGEHIKQNPFIPEYLGFTETVITDQSTGAVTARVYTKKGFNISRPVSTEKHSWLIMDSEGKTNTLLIENMRHGIDVLRACGMKVSMNDYFEYNAKMEQELIGKINDEINNAEKIEESVKKKLDE